MIIFNSTKLILVQSCSIFSSRESLVLLKTPTQSIKRTSIFISKIVFFNWKKKFVWIGVTFSFNWKKSIFILLVNQSKKARTLNLWLALADKLSFGARFFWKIAVNQKLFFTGVFLGNLPKKWAYPPRRGLNKW